MISTSDLRRASARPATVEEPAGAADGTPRPRTAAPATMPEPTCIYYDPVPLKHEPRRLDPFR